MKAILVLLIAVSASVTTFSQTSGKSSHTKIEATPPTYRCPMDTAVVSNKPGKCPRCGMDLTRVKKFTCSMHPEIVTNKPGYCPKCGMELTEVETKKGKKS